MKIKDNNSASSKDDAIITAAIIPAVVSGKKGNFIAEYNHNALHSTKGNIMGLEFYQAIASKLDQIVNKQDVSEINGNPVGEFAEIGSWSELDINHFHRNDQFNVTYNLGYEKNPNVELNPSGVTITFAFTE